MTNHQCVLAARPAADRLGDTRLFGPGHKMIHQNSEAPSRAGAELGDDIGQIIHTAEILDHHTLGPEIITPHLLDEFGVMASFDVDPTGQRHPGPGVGDFHRTGRGALRGRRTVAQWRGQDHRATLDQEPGAEREDPIAPVPIL